MKTTQIDKRRVPGYYPYYKVQWRDPISDTWRDVQRRFPTPEEARHQAPLLCPGRVTRLMEIRRDGRSPVPA